MIICMGDIFWKFRQPLYIIRPFFKVERLQKRDKDDFQPNFKSFTFLSRHHARASIWHFQPIFSKQLGCKTYYRSLSYAKYFHKVFIMIRKVLPFPYLWIFMILFLFYIAYFVFVLYIVTCKVIATEYAMF